MPRVHRFADALLHRRDIFLRNDAALDGVDEFEMVLALTFLGIFASGSTGSIGFISIFTWPYWPRPPVCLMYLPSASAEPRMVSRYATCGLPTFATTPNSRFMRSTRISRCSSPMPLMMVSPVSSSVETRNVGSSSESFQSAMPIFSWSAFVAGSMRKLTTGSGNLISEHDRVRLVAERVGGLGVFQADCCRDFSGEHLLRPPRACRPGAARCGRGALCCPCANYRYRSRRSPCRSRRGRRSAAPTNGSVWSLKASAENGSSSDAGASIFSPVFGFVPVIGGISSGEGR